MSESTEQLAAAAESEPLSPVEIPTLKSLFVELRFGETVLGNATAFLAANDQKSHCALITNRHVVTGRHQDTGECLHSQGGIPDNIVIHFHKQEPQLGEWLPTRASSCRTGSLGRVIAACHIA
jgi:hypothetical protein